jgi:GNAT superfamily N-acetyltransferase
MQSAPQLRPALAADAEFVIRVIETTMRAHIERTWGSFDADETRRRVLGNIEAGNCSIIRWKNQDIGVFTIAREPTEIKLEQIFILPPFQRKGLGTGLIRVLAAEAKVAGKPLRLRVLAVNPARELYEREGFAVTQTTPERIYMERHA